MDSWALSILNRTVPAGTVALNVAKSSTVVLKMESPVLLRLRWQSPVLLCLKWKRPKSPHFLSTVLLKVEKYSTVALIVNQPLEATSGHFWRQGSKMLKISLPRPLLAPRFQNAVLLHFRPCAP